MRERWGGAGDGKSPNGLPGLCRRAGTKMGKYGEGKREVGTPSNGGKEDAPGRDFLVGWKAEGLSIKLLGFTESYEEIASKKEPLVCSKPWKDSASLGF